MVVDKKILDELSAKAKENPRLRCNLDMRNSADDQSQRMLNAIEPGSPLPIHRHQKTLRRWFARGDDWCRSSTIIWNGDARKPSNCHQTDRL